MRGNRTAPCDQCGKDYISWTYQRRRFCSPACARQSAHRTLQDRLTSNIAITGGHWLWQGRPSKRGYGRLSFEGRVIPAHQAAWVAAAGPIPDGLFVCHTCDIKMCVRNDESGVYEVGGFVRPRQGHLWLGTNADNMLDKTLKGRAEGSGLFGSAHPNALLTEADVREIRALYATGEWNQHRLGLAFGVTNGAIWRIVHRLAWQHVE